MVSLMPTNNIDYNWPIIRGPYPATSVTNIVYGKMFEWEIYAFRVEKCLYLQQNINSLLVDLYCQAKRP